MSSAAFSAGRAQTLQQVEPCSCQPRRLHPGARLSAPGPVSCVGLCRRSPEAPKANNAGTRVCRSLEWLLKSKVESLDGLRGSLWGQKRALSAL